MSNEREPFSSQDLVTKWGKINTLAYPGSIGKMQEEVADALAGINKASIQQLFTTVLESAQDSQNHINIVVATMISPLLITQIQPALAVANAAAEFLSDSPENIKVGGILPVQTNLDTYDLQAAIAGTLVADSVSDESLRILFTAEPSLRDSLVGITNPTSRIHKNIQSRKGLRKVTELVERIQRRLNPPPSTQPRRG